MAQERPEPAPATDSAVADCAGGGARSVDTLGRVSATVSGTNAGRSVALVTLGCARNEVDSEELAGRLAAAGWRLVGNAAQADVALVNTCGFVEQAKKDSIDVLLEAAELREDPSARTRAVAAVGCLAERYGAELAGQLPEADAVLGFDSYTELSNHLDAVLGGHAPASHVPRDRRTLLPLAPAARVGAAGPIPGHGDRPVDTGLVDTGLVDTGLVDTGLVDTEPAGLRGPA